jgi:hypothetical protein
MRELAEGLMTLLAGLYGQENVYHGYAEKDAAIPYVNFFIDAAGEISEYAGASSALDGGIATYPVRVSCWCRTYSLAAIRLEEVIMELTANPTTMKFANDKLIHTRLISHEITQDEIAEQDATVVYRGYALVEITMTKGAR